MGYASVMYVPRLLTYEQAKRHFDGTNPIRGTDTRPLGRRKDHRMYSIRENDTGAIELVCYRTPVVTFEKPPNDTQQTIEPLKPLVRVKIDGWNSVSTRQFIWRTLGIHTSAQKDYCVLEIKGDKYTLKRDEELLLELGMGYGGRSGDGGWTVLNHHPRMSYRINRKGANNVRAMYKPFADYLKGFIALRATELSVKGMWGRPDYEYQVFQITLRELGEVFGVTNTEETFARVLRSGSPHATQLATQVVNVPGGYELKQTHSKLRKSKTEKMLELIKSGDHAKFYRAALWLCNPSHDMRLAFIESEADTSVFNCAADIPLKLFNDFIMLHHAHDTVDVYPTPKGKVPSEKYKQWLE